MNLQPPNLLLALSNAPRALADMAILGMTAPLLRKLPPTRRRQSVMVIPGFLGDDRGHQPLIRFLNHLGYTATGWGQGRNLGPQSFSEDGLSTPPTVPTTAIYTRADGVVNWRTSLQNGDDHHVHNIEVLGSHIGLNFNAAVWYWIAKKLATESA